MYSGERPGITQKDTDVYHHHSVDWLMREKSKERKQKGIQWIPWTQLEDMDLGECLTLLSDSQGKMQARTTAPDPPISIHRIMDPIPQSPECQGWARNLNIGLINGEGSGTRGARAILLSWNHNQSRAIKMALP